MTADPQQIKRILDYRGIDVRLDGDRLIARPRSGSIPDDMVRFIRHFKPVIIAELRARTARPPCASDDARTEIERLTTRTGPLEPKGRLAIVDDYIQHR